MSDSAYRTPYIYFGYLVQALLLLHLFFIGADWFTINRIESRSGGPTEGEVVGSRFGLALFGDATTDRLILVRGADGVLRPCTNGSDKWPVDSADMRRSALFTLALIAGCRIPKLIESPNRGRVMRRKIRHAAQTVFTCLVFFALLGFGFLRL